MESDELADLWSKFAIAISIHALRVESDSAPTLIEKEITEFQSTLSVWRATIGQAVKIFRYSSSLNISALKYLRLKSFEFIKGYVIIFKAVRLIYAFPECDFEQSVYLSG